MGLILFLAWFSELVLTIRFCSRHWLREFGKVTRGDLVFFAVLGAVPACGLFIMITESTSSFWSKTVWPK